MPSLPQKSPFPLGHEGGGGGGGATSTIASTVGSTPPSIIASATATIASADASVRFASRPPSSPAVIEASGERPSTVGLTSGRRASAAPIEASDWAAAASHVAQAASGLDWLGLFSAGGGGLRPKTLVGPPRRGP